MGGYKLCGALNKGRQLNELRTEKEKEKPERFINSHLGLQIYKMYSVSPHD
jgi:hypothetical protein